MDRWFPLETERLLLRELGVDDEHGIHLYASDPEVSRFDVWGPNTPEMSRKFLTGLLTQQEQWPRSSVTLAIELKNESRLIGTIRLSIKDESNLTGDFGFALNRYYLNQGYATEAARAIVDVAFQQLGLHRIWAGCDTNNHASSRVMEKLGMRREALFRKEVLQKGESRDSFLYTVLAEEWLGFARQEAEK